MLRTATVWAIVGCASLIAIATAQPKENAAPRQQLSKPEGAVELTIRLLEKHGDVTKILANPTITAVEGRPFTFIAGGEVDGTSPSLTFGTKVSGTAGKRKTNVIPVAIEISVGQLIKTDDPDTKAVRSHSIDLRMDLQPSAKKTVQIDDQTWCEVVAL